MRPTSVHFAYYPVASVSRAVSDYELDTMFKYESHVAYCDQCYRAIDSKRLNRYCDQGWYRSRRLTNLVISYDGHLYSAYTKRAYFHRIEIPRNMWSVKRTLTTKEEQRYGAQIPSVDSVVHTERLVVKFRRKY